VLCALTSLRVQLIKPRDSWSGPVLAMDARRQSLDPMVNVLFIINITVQLLAARPRLWLMVNHPHSPLCVWPFCYIGWLASFEIASMKSMRSHSQTRLVGLLLPLLLRWRPRSRSEMPGADRDFGWGAGGGSEVTRTIRKRFFRRLLRLNEAETDVNLTFSSAAGEAETSGDDRCTKREQAQVKNWTFTARG
jgi:hypothetical protein